MPVLPGQLPARVIDYRGIQDIVVDERAKSNQALKLPFDSNSLLGCADVLEYQIRNFGFDF